MNNQDTLNNGKDAPSFEYEDMSGEVVSLNDFIGEKVYLKYWTSWCSACLSGLKEIDSLSEIDAGFSVITVVSPNYKGEMSQIDLQIGLTHYLMTI